MKAFDPSLASGFRMDWLVPLDALTQDDYERAVAEKAATLLRSARFLDSQRQAEDADLEVRVWVEAACGPACVAVTYEPGAQRFGFYLLDESLRERLGCVLFDDVPCVDAEGSLGQMDALLDAALRAVQAAEKDAELSEIADRVRHARDAVRVPVEEGPRPERREP